MRKRNKLNKAGSIKHPQAPEKAASAAPAPFDPTRLLHDLQDHQAELQMQNRELRETHLLLELSRDRYADLYDFAPVGYVTLDDKGLVQEINLTGAGMLGVERSRLIGLPFSLYVVKEDLPAFREHLRKLARPGDLTAMELGLTVKAGGTIQVELQSVPVLDALRKTRLCRSTLTDITERKRAEEALRRSEAHLARAQEIAHVGSYGINLVDPSGASWSAETFRILGLDPSTEELSPSDYVARMVHPEDQARVRETFDKALHERSQFDIEYRIMRPDGSLRHVHSIVEPLPGTDNQVVKLLGTLQDITERKGLEREILEISEREQKRIGQDLHDGLCQHLAGIEFRLLGLKQKLQDKAKKQAAEATELAKLVREGIEQTRTLARGLSPVMLEPDGLMSALQELATNTEKAFQISCSFNCPSPVLIRDNAVATHLYRIAQEAVQNAIRHGKAKHVVINLFAQNDRVVLGVRDDGVGFPKKPRKHGGMGLRVMQYRAGMVGGSLVVQREPEGGTSVICSLRAPLGAQGTRVMEHGH